MAEKKIKKIRLSDNQVYAIFDEGAARVDPVTHKLLSGNAVVDQLILDGNLFITQIDDQDVAIDNILTVNTATGEIMKRDADKLLEDIGGISCAIDAATGKLSFKFGRQ